MYTERKCRSTGREEVCCVSNEAAFPKETHMYRHTVTRCDLPLGRGWCSLGIFVSHRWGVAFLGLQGRSYTWLSVSFCRSFQIRRGQPQLAGSKAQKLRLECCGLKEKSPFFPPCRLEETFLYQGKC